MAKSEIFGLWINQQLLIKSKQALTYIEELADENSFAFHDLLLGVLWHTLDVSSKNKGKKEDVVKSVFEEKASEVKSDKVNDTVQKTTPKTITKGKTWEFCAAGKQYVTIPQTISELKNSSKTKKDKESSDTNVEVISIEDDDCEILSAGEDDKGAPEVVKAGEEGKATPTKKVLVENVECSYFDMDCEEINDNDVGDEVPTDAIVPSTNDNEFKIEVNEMNVEDDATDEVKDSLLDSIGIQRKVPSDNSKDIRTLNRVTKVTDQSSAEPVPSTSWAGRDSPSPSQEDLNPSNSRDSVDGSMVTNDDYQPEDIYLLDNGKKTKSRTRRSLSHDRSSEENTPRKKRLLDHDKKWHMAPKHSLDQDKYLALPGGIDGNDPDDGNTNQSESDVTDDISSPVVKIEKLDADCDNHVMEFRPDDYFKNADDNAKSSMPCVSRIRRGSKRRGRPRGSKLMESSRKVLSESPKKTSVSLKGFGRGKKPLKSLLTKIGHHGLLGRSEQHEKSETGRGKSVLSHLQMRGKTRGVGRGTRRGRQSKYQTSGVGRTKVGLKSKKNTETSATSFETESNSDVRKTRGKLGRSRNYDSSSKKAIGRGKKSKSTNIDSDCDNSSVDEEGYVEDSEWTTLGDENKKSQHAKSLKDRTRSRKKRGYKEDDYLALSWGIDDKESEDENTHQNERDMINFLSSPVVKIEKLDADFDNLLKDFRPDNIDDNARGSIGSTTRVTRGTRRRGRPRGSKLNLGNRFTSYITNVSMRGLGRGRNSLLGRFGYRGARGRRGHHEIPSRGRGKSVISTVQVRGKKLRGVGRGLKCGQPSIYSTSQQREVAEKQLKSLKAHIRSTKSHIKNKTVVAASSSSKTEATKTDNVIKRKPGRPRKLNKVGKPARGRGRKIVTNISDSDSDLSSVEEQGFVEESEWTSFDDENKLSECNKKSNNKKTDLTEQHEDDDNDSDCLIMDDEYLYGSNEMTVNKVTKGIQQPGNYADMSYENAGSFVTPVALSYASKSGQGAGNFVDGSHKGGQDSITGCFEGAGSYASDMAGDYITEETRNYEGNGSYVPENVRNFVDDYQEGPSGSIFDVNNEGTRNYVTGDGTYYDTEGGVNSASEGASSYVTEEGRNFVAGENRRVWNYVDENNVYDDAGDNHNVNDEDTDVILID
ncbi:hypothetical protein ACF0H5_014366 [Mactra antiquata]